MTTELRVDKLLDMSTEKTATYIREVGGYAGIAYLFKLSEPLDGHEMVIVSAIDAPYSGEETYIFPAEEDASGKWVVADWLELSGSYRGGVDHELALNDAGYKVAWSGKW